MKSPSDWGRRIPLVALTLLAVGCSPDSSGVTPPPTIEPPLTSGSVLVNRSAMLLTAVGQSRQLTARTMNSSGSSVNAAVEWSSSAPDQVSVDASGRVTARAIGSAQVFARSGGVTSAPVLVVVAEPPPGALLVTDAQVVSVGAPLGLAAGEMPGVGTRYEVRLTGVATPPPPGTVVLAAEDAHVAGKVVSTRTESGALVVTLAFTPLVELFARYNINWKIDLSTLPASASPSWSGGPANMSSSSQPTSTAAAPFISQIINAFNCDASLAPVLADKKIQIAPNGSLSLDIVEEPGHTRRALVGSLKLVGLMSLKLNAGFKFTGKCEAAVPIPVAFNGPLAVLILPVVRLGVGASVEGQVFVTAGEISVTGELGVKVELGWECGGAFAGCQSLPGLTADNKFTPKFEVFNPASGMRVEVAGQFYFLAGLDLDLLSSVNIPIVEAKIGPVQSVDLGFEEDQAIVEYYASKYDLKVEGVVEPGSGLQTALNAIRPGLSLTFQGKVTIPISESPKGVLTVSKPRVNLSGETVDMRVDLKNTDYFLIGYNVEHVELWQKRATESQFKVLRSFNITASNQTTFNYTWTPTTDDLGLNEFAVFVYTKFPVPGLEIADNSIQKVDVQCFSARVEGDAPTAAANTCADTWQGTAKFFSPGELQIDASVTWVRDPNTPEIDGNVSYIATGTATVKFLQLENRGCSVSQTTFPIRGDNVMDNNDMLIDYSQTPTPFFIGSEIALHVTVSCPNEPSFFYPLLGVWAIGNGNIDQNGLIKGRTDAGGGIYWEWSFKRP